MQIIIERWQRSNRIRIIGLIEDVTDVTANVVKILANTKLKEQEKDEAERLAKQVTTQKSNVPCSSNSII